MGISILTTHLPADSIAELKIIGGRIFLRDLGSANGTYLVFENNLEYFKEGYVELLQPIVMGRLKYTVRSLLAISSPFDFTLHSI